MEPTLPLAIIAVVKFIKTLPFGDSLKGLVTILFAVALGILAGLAGYESYTWFTGLIAGLTAIGGVTIADRIAGE
ncbi:MAG: hypothetical protein NUV80_04970 [Candidatus Berkelbacteria bacterium]|nr:hypothetical protein [Candidatus Berkelbacteria bacterium]